MKKLTEDINKLLSSIKSSHDVIDIIKKKKMLYPFSEIATLLSYFVSIDVLTFEDYLRICDDYYMRNKYLPLYDMAPRTYGQTWGEKHIRTLFPEFIKATKENLVELYPSFDGEFDLWLDGIRVEVKACRANSVITATSLSERAYLHKDAKEAGFKYHFQQLKPSCCDVFIWIGTCCDELLYWVLTSDELIGTGKLGPQHRNENTGIGDDIFEGQVFMTEEELEPYRVDEKDVLGAVKIKCKR